MATENENDNKNDNKGDYNPADRAWNGPGVIPQAPQDKDLAEKGIFQPFDQATNTNTKDSGVGVLASDDDKELHDKHAANVRHLPPVPAERAGAASQAK
jgi:hypothetical protein